MLIFHNTTTARMRRNKTSIKTLKNHALTNLPTLASSLALGEALSRNRELRSPDRMIHDKAAALHQRIADGRPGELEPELPQSLAHRIAFRGGRGDARLVGPEVELRPGSRHEAPKQGVEVGAHLEQ